MRRFSLFLSLIMALVMMAISPATMWADVTFSGSGSGTESDPYQIATAAQLAEFRDLVNAGNDSISGKLTADIDLSSVCHPADAEDNTIVEVNWIPIGIYDSIPFTGTFNGQGHSITGMYMNFTTSYQGLFGFIEGATVKNFSLSGEMTSSVTGLVKIGGLVGLTSNATVENICCAVNMQMKAGKTYGHIGGVVASLCAHSVVKGCIYTGTLNAGASTDCVGGIVGYTNNSKIVNCLNTGDITTSANTTGTYIAGILGYQNNGSFQGAFGCLNLGTITAGGTTAKRGAIYGWYRSSANTGGYNYYLQGSATRGVGANNSGQDLTEVCVVASKAQLQSGEVCGTGKPAAQGTGTAADPYIISTLSEMVWFCDVVNGARGWTKNDTACAKLNADIDMTTKPNTMMAAYNGIFDGNDHKITISFNCTESNVGLFGYLSGTVKNLTVDGTITTTNSYAGGFAARTQGNNAQIIRCASLVDIISTLSGDGTHGGFVAVAEQGTKIIDCIFAGSITGASTNSCGGIVGWGNKGTSTLIQNTLMLGTLAVDATNANTFCRNYVNCINCYYITPLNATPSGCTQITADQLKSGEVCYKLNNGMADGLQAWHQQLGTDSIPHLFPADYAVYLACDTDTVRYTNTEPEHNYVDGVCTICGAYEPATRVGDTFEIANGGQFRWWADKVNKENVSFAASKAVLVDDITLSGAYTPVGNEGTSFVGEFDGQGYTIYMDSVTGNRNYYGVFGYIGAATVANVVVDGTIVVEGTHVHLAGVVGDIHGNAVIKGCSFLGTLDAGSSHDCVGGVVGYAASGNFSITNCFCGGKLKTMCTTGVAMGGILGYINDNSNKHPVIQHNYSDGQYYVGSTDSTNFVNGIVGIIKNNAVNIKYNSCLESIYINGVCQANAADIEIDSSNVVITISVEAEENGTVSKSYVLPTDSTATMLLVEATPNEGYEFDRWTDGGEQSHQVSLSEVVELVASFKEPAAGLHDATDGEGTASVKKVLIDGKVYIICDDQVYDITGRKY